MQYSYETIGTSSYLVVTFAGGEGLINYQLQMLINNEIKNVLAVNKSQLNDDVRLSYNITSRVSLADMDENRKIPKIGVIHIIEGALAALKDIEEYQLASAGLVFDEKYIYVKPDTFEPSFIYVPTSTADCGIEGLKKMLLDMIMGSNVEITNDTFVQTLLATLNDPAVTADVLADFCEKAKLSGGASAVSKAPVVTPKPDAAPVPKENPQPVRVISMDGGKPKNNIPVSAKPEIKNNTKKADKPQKSSGSKKTVFTLLQILFVVVLAAAFASGMLNDTNGNLVIEYCLGVVLGVAAVDFIVYREMFVNNKENNAANGKSKSGSSKPAAAKPSNMAIPGKEPNFSIPSNDSAPQSGYKKVEEKSPAPVSAPEPVTFAPASGKVPAYNSVDDFESEATVLMGADGAVPGVPKVAYLEYFDKAKGGNAKIMLDKPAVVIGKLAGQCDVVINEQTISKVHAEFIVRNGEYFVKDYASTNGTYINGDDNRIVSNTEYQIHNGDTITLAGVDMVLKA